jgi:DNA primase
MAVVQKHISVTDLVSLLEYAGIRRIKVRDREISFCCPLHTDNTPSASIHVDKKTFHCFSCHTGKTLYGFLKLLDVHDVLNGVRQYHIEHKNPDKTSVVDLPDSYDDFEAQSLNMGTTEKGKEIFNAAGPISMSKLAQDYMNKRLGEKYKLPIQARYNEYTSSIIFKTPYNFVERRLKETDKIRYSSYGKELNLFCSYETIGGPLIIVEGVFDYLTLVNYGYRNSAAILTSRLTAKELVNLNQLLFSEIVFCPDNDKAGVKNFSANVRDLQQATTMPLSIMLLKGKKDLNNLTFDEFMTFYTDRRRVSDLQRKKLEKAVFE